MLKHFVRFMFTFTILFSFHATQAFGATLGNINGDNVNIRQEASTMSSILDTVNHSSPVIVTGSIGDFYQVSHGGNNAYIHKKYVSITASEGVINATNVNMRAAADTNGAVLGQLNFGDVVSVKASSNGWLKVIANGREAYVNDRFVTGDSFHLLPSFDSNENISFYAVVTSDTGLNLREQPSTESHVLEALGKGAILDAIESDAEWVKVQSDSGTVGFVSAEFVQLKNGVKPTHSSKGQEVAAYAKQFLGCPYTYGGTSPKSGFDCSGLVYTVYKNFGVTLNRSSRGMASNGREVAKSELTPGDLVLFRNGGANIGHVGIYVGNGQYIHSSTYGVGVIISDLNSRSSANGYVTARRIF